MTAKALLFFILGGLCIIAAFYFILRKLDWWVLVPLVLVIGAVILVFMGLSETKKRKS